MLKEPASFPHVGSYCYFDHQTSDGQDVVERARIQRDNGDGTALLSIDSRRFPREVASGNRTVPFDQLRESEQATPTRNVNDTAAVKTRRRRAR